MQDKHPKRQIKKGFTLAEVLITLGIIGVVAAMTIPVLISSYQEKQYLTQFKETYSMLAQAYTQAAQEYGTADTWANMSTDAPNYFKDYIKTSKVCDLTVTYPWCNDGDRKKDLYGNDRGNYTYQMVLANGANLYFFRDGIYNGILADINGKNKPNQYGYDMFYLSLATKDGTPIVTYPYYNEAWSVNNSSQCLKSSANTGWLNGGTCATWILKHWNMDYLHRDIPDSEWIK